MASAPAPRPVRIRQPPVVLPREAPWPAQQVWAGPLSNDSFVVVLWNLGERAAKIDASWAAIGIPAGSTCTVRDMWARKWLADAAGSVSAVVPGHDVAALRLATKRSDGNHVVALKTDQDFPVKSAYRSIIGDAGMRWQPSGYGPRMQFLSRNLCAKAGPAEMSVLPMAGDTCGAPPGPAGMLPGRGEVSRVNAPDCCRACLAQWWCRAWTEPLPGVCSLKDNALPLRRLRNTTAASGVRRYTPAQVLPSPRYANCIVNGSQTIAHRDNAARAADEDDEWFAVVKEQTLGGRCEKPDPLGASSSHFWSVMTTNENGWTNLGTDAECLPQCYHSGDQQRPAGWPPAVNASESLCPDSHERVSSTPRFNQGERDRMFRGLT
jgi:hypothetical protein